MISKTLSLVTLFVVAQAATNLDYSKVHLLDYKPNGNTWLFRTNMPLVDGAFAFDKLRAYMAQRAAESNVSFPTADKPLKISDFSLLSWFEEPDLLTTEQNFYKENPSMGDFSHQQIFGAVLNPNDFNEQNIRIPYILTMENTVDSLPPMMETLHSQIHKQTPSIPTAYIIHGNYGTDRTGEIAGAYMLAFKNKTLQEVLQWNNEIAQGSRIEIQYQIPLLDYCWWMVYKLGQDRKWLGCEQGLNLPKAESFLQ